MAILFSVSRFCLMLCFVCFLADFWDGHTASIGSFNVYTYLLYQTKKRCNYIYFCRCRGGLFRQKKRISGRLESTPKLIELKHFKKSNSSRNDTINAVEGSDEMNQWKWSIYNVSNEIMTLKIRDQFVRAAARLHRRITQGGYLQFVHL